MIPRDIFPRLKDDNHRITSPETRDYNCIAWAAGDMQNWWQPGVFWPVEATQDDYGIAALIQVFRAMGFEPCESGDSEPNFEKIALYNNGRFYAHAARQLSTGKWTSKLGRTEDIEHDAPDDVAGGVYGDVSQFMKRLVTK
jgi:hypothetical protein